MNSKHFLIKKIFFAKSAIRMHEDNIATLIKISPFQMPSELSLSVESLFF